MAKTLNLCKVMIKSDIDDNLEIYKVDSIELCYETKIGIEILTGDLSGNFICNLNNRTGDEKVFGWVEKISDIKRFTPSNSIDDLRDFLESNLLGRYYYYNSLNSKFEPYQNEYFDNEEYDIPMAIDFQEEVQKEEKKVFLPKEHLSISKIEACIKKTIINQDKAIQKVLIAVYGNQKIITSSLSKEEKMQLKNNILLFGSTGTGKTEIVRQVAKYFDLPISIEDATRYTVAGYVGASVDDMIKNLIRKAGNNVERAQNGILVIDEIDKKRSKKDSSSGIETDEVQYSLLKLIEGGTFNIAMKPDSTIEFDSSLLTVILCGAFTNLLEQPGNSNIRSLGFNSSFILKENKLLSTYTPEDFIKYGMIPELIGRVSLLVKTNDLTIPDIKRIILESDISPLRLKQKLYKEVYNVEFSITEDFIDDISKKVFDLKTGARGINLVLDEYFGDLEFKILSNNIKKVNLESSGIKLIRKR